MKRLTTCGVTGPLKLRLAFEDGVAGEVDFSKEPLTGVFSAWRDADVFAQVRVGRNGRTLEWPGEIDLCADSLWVQVRGARPEDVMPGLKSSLLHNSHA